MGGVGEAVHVTDLGDEHRRQRSNPGQLLDRLIAAVGVQLYSFKAFQHLGGGECHLQIQVDVPYLAGIGELVDRQRVDHIVEFADAATLLELEKHRAGYASTLKYRK